MSLFKPSMVALSLSAILISPVINAASYFPAKEPITISNSPSWVFSGGIGFYKVQDMLNKDGETFFTRISVEKLFYQQNQNVLGFEVGVQNGNQSRLGMTDAQNDDLGGTSVMTTLKPEFDFLLTYHRNLSNNMTSGYLKAGGMYRHISFDRGTTNDLRRVNFELQAGVSQKVTETVSMSIGYQGVFSGSLGLQTSPLTNTGTIKNIPSQHGVLFSVNYYA